MGTLYLHTFRLIPFEKLGEALALSCKVRLLDAALNLEFSLSGALDDILLPSASHTPRFVDGLWRRTCFEFFLSRGNQDAYLEWNFSPSGDWAVYVFDSYRKESAAGLHICPLWALATGNVTPARSIRCERFPGSRRLSQQAQRP